MEVFDSRLPDKSLFGQCCVVLPRWLYCRLTASSQGHQCNVNGTFRQRKVDDASQIGKIIEVD